MEGHPAGVRIALVAPLVASLGDPPLGGAQTVVADLAMGLTSRGHEVDVYAATGSLVPGARVVDVGVEAAGLGETRFQSGGQQIESPASRAAFARVYGRIRTEPYDVVHNHAFDPAAVELGVGAARLIVHTVHLPPASSMVGCLLACRERGDAALVVAVSAAQARGWATTLRVDTVIRNGIPVSLIPFSDRTAEGAVFAGRLSPEKGAREAIEIAQAAGIDIDVYGDAYDAAYARSQIEPFRTVPGVALHPPAGRSDLWLRMSTARAVLCPAMWDEPFGLVAAEAMAAGTPVIAFRRGALAEIIEDGVTGRLIEPGDIGAAASALGDVSGLDRAACRQHAIRTLDLTPVLEAHEELYLGRLGSASLG